MTTSVSITTTVCDRVYPFVRLRIEELHVTSADLILTSIQKRQSLEIQYLFYNNMDPGHKYIQAEILGTFAFSPVSEDRTFEVELKQVL